MRVHLIAACGVGMSALAALLRAAGHAVTGSDEHAYPPASTFLEELGIPVHSGWDATRVQSVDLVVCGNAVRRGNPEAMAAEANGVRMTSFPQALSELFLAARRPLVVAGTHGKTTSAAMLAWVLTRTGRAPGFLVGGIPLDLGTSAALGSGPWFVVEGDEYDSAYFDKEPKFVHYRPDMVVLTGIEFDHADIYADVDAVKAGFRKLLALVPPGAPVIACGDFPHVRDVLAGTSSRAISFGAGPTNDWQITNVRDDGMTRAVVREHGVPRCELQLVVPGSMNVCNALGVLLVAREVGVGWEEGVAALAEFRGVRRRQQVMAEARGVTVIDDFAHHPTAVAGTLAALRLRYPGRRLRAVFEPRSNTSRRRIFQREYVDALAAADEAVLARVFVKESDPIPASERLDPETIAQELVQRGVPARALEGAPPIRDYLVDSALAGDVIVVMSNGAFGGLPRLLGDALRV